jgi:hypothetical protein
MHKSLDEPAAGEPGRRPIHPQQAKGFSNHAAEDAVFKKIFALRRRLMNASADILTPPEMQHEGRISC